MVWPGLPGRSFAGSAAPMAPEGLTCPKQSRSPIDHRGGCRPLTRRSAVASVLMTAPRCCSALGWVKVVAVGVAVPDSSVLLVNQMLDTVLLSRCAAGDLGFSLGVVGARGALSTLAAVGPPLPRSGRCARSSSRPSQFPFRRPQVRVAMDSIVSVHGELACALLVCRCRAAWRDTQSARAIWFHDLPCARATSTSRTLA